jgi:hypothetical protein
MTSREPLKLLHVLSSEADSFWPPVLQCFAGVDQLEMRCS